MDAKPTTEEMFKIERCQQFDESTCLGNNYYERTCVYGVYIIYAYELKKKSLESTSCSLDSTLLAGCTVRSRAGFANYERSKTGHILSTRKLLARVAFECLIS